MAYGRLEYSKQFSGLGRDGGGDIIKVMAAKCMGLYEAHSFVLVVTADQS